MRNIRRNLNLMVAVILMAISRRSLGAGLLFRRYVRRSRAWVLTPYNQFGGVNLEVDGRVIHFRHYRSSDYEVYYQVFGNLEFDALCKYLLLNGVGTFVFVDCGANIGLASAYMQLKFKEAKFVGIEPSQNNVKVASMNMSYDKLFPRALTSKSGNKVRLFSPPEDSGEWAFRIVHDDMGGIESMHLDALLKELSPWNGLPFILKVDIEGAEFDVFLNVTSDVLRRFEVVIVEIHEFIGDVHSLVQHICLFGFSAFPMGEYWFFRRLD